MLDRIDRFRAAAARLDALIDRTPTPDDRSLEAVQVRAGERMDRLRRFLARLGDPLTGYPIIHVGGTSGKGSTSTAIAATLTAAGYRTGLHTSPYLQTPAEKLQCDGRLIAPDRFVALTDELLDTHERWLTDGNPVLTYGEAWIALMALFFRAEEVDVAVVEVGAGGRFDLTNIVAPVVSVVTTVGIDHTATLGDTIEAIAWHKAGIIKPGAPAITGVTQPAALSILAAEANAATTSLRRVIPGETFTDVVTTLKSTSWRELPSGAVYSIGLAGRFQALNGALAVAAVEALRGQGMTISDEAVRRGLARTRIPGRAETMQRQPTVLLDGAHNAEKIGALAAELPTLLPRPDRGRRVVLLGVLETKQADRIIAALAPHMDVLLATAPRVLAKPAIQAIDLARAARQTGFTGPILVEPEPAEAIAQALAGVRDAERDSILVTGSLYLVGNVRERWYPEAAIVAAGSPWSTPGTEESPLPLGTVAEGCL
ncbi:MAG: bifunctional folylpolyglutamate synthase/dihydrofolate synthase [Chloroflexia bacterium]|nr:bifunctional folylpolyglutamate synthase/dihydrofolate synthase [Chloroflexia bacterium]